MRRSSVAAVAKETQQATVTKPSKSRRRNLRKSNNSHNRIGLITMAQLNRGSGLQMSCFGCPVPKGELTKVGYSLIGTLLVALHRTVDGS